MMESAILGWVSQGLQHEVIAMASCCKKGGGQKGNNCHRQTCSGTTGITVLMRDWVVVAGAGFSGIRCSRLEPLTITYHDKREMRPHSLVTQLMVSASACAFTTTERALTSNRPWAQERRSISMLLPVVPSSLPRYHTVPPRW